jgi:putative ABC transport system permease protein
MGALVVLLALTLGLVIFDSFRRPGLRRLAVRNIVRRPGEAALVVLGSMLGTAIICTSFIVGDTFGASIRDIAPAKLGEVDVSMTAAQPSQLMPAIAAAHVDTLPGVDGSLTAYRTGATVATPGSKPGRKAEPFATVTETDFDAARTFGADPEATGMVDAGSTPKGDEIVLGRDLAEKLDVAVGGTVEVYAYGTTRTFTVRTIVDRRGVAGLDITGGSKAYTSFVAPGTIDAMRAEGKALGAAPPESDLFLSAKGGVFDGVTAAGPLYRALKQRVGTLDGITLYKSKKDLLDNADAQSSSLRALFSGIGGFSIIAGLLLLVNIFVMLAEERKAELGVLRAVGLKRNHLVRTFGIEGAIYATLAAIVGGIVGIGIARGISTIAADISKSANEEFAHKMGFTVKPASVLVAMLVGLVISMVTIWATSLRIGRLNIIRAIREQAEPPRDPRSRRSMVLAILGVVVGVLMLQSGVAGKTAPPTSLGPAIALFSSMLLLRRRVRERLALSVPAVLVILFEMNAFAIFPDAYRNPAIAAFVVQGVTTSAAAVVLAAANADLIASAAERLGGASLAARLGVAYPLARRFRTGLLLAMYSLIIFTLTFMATFAHVFEAQTPQVANEMRGGFDLFVGSSWSNPVTPDALRKEPGVQTVAPLRRGGLKFQTAAQTEPQWWSTSGFDLQLLAGGAPTLRETWRGMSEKEAWALAAAGTFGQKERFFDAHHKPFTPIPAIIPNFFLAQGNGPPPAAPKAGLLVDMVDPTSHKTVKLIAVGIVAGDWAGNGVYLSDHVLSTFAAPKTTVVSRYFVKVAPGADAEKVADRITADLIPYGADAHTFREMVAIGTSTQAAFFRLIQGYLGLGLLVGIAGLGVVMVRAVRERRRQIGMLRAMGFQSSVVRRAFLLEATFIAAQGIVIGVGLGLLTAWSTLSNSDALSSEHVSFSVPVGTVVILLIVPLLASLLGVLAPANSASRVRPAVALRIAD